MTPSVLLRMRQVILFFEQRKTTYLTAQGLMWDAYKDEVLQEIEDCF